MSKTDNDRGVIFASEAAIKAILSSHPAPAALYHKFVDIGYDLVKDLNDEGQHDLANSVQTQIDHFIMHIPQT